MNNKRVSLNMLFWHDGREDSTRLRNVLYTWSELKKLTKFLNESGKLSAVCNMYDFSYEKHIEDSTHISYPVGVYKLSEKRNIIVSQQKDCDFIMMVDCDAFFDIVDYSNLLLTLDEMEPGNIVTFDLAKLDDNIENYMKEGVFDRDSADWRYAYSGDRSRGPLYHSIGGLGGVFISDINLITSVGGFNEKYHGWGGEDGEIIDRIYRSGKLVRHTPTRTYAPFHLPHFTDWGSSLYRAGIVTE